jgi:peroxiredoxin Q/BCP
MAEKHAPENGMPGVGDAAPEFSAKADDNRTVRLRDLKGKWVVLYWFPKDDTPG